MANVDAGIGSLPHVHDSARVLVKPLALDLHLPLDSGEIDASIQCLAQPISLSQ
jgi:hypothetical protein